MSEDVRIGVFICDCGDEIAKSVSVDKLLKDSLQIRDVAFAQRLYYGCSREGLADIKRAIQEEGLNRVVVAGCTPRTHEPLFRKAIEEAGLNPFLLEMVNIRDQCSWVHPRQKRKATGKGKVLIRMGVAKAALLQPREPLTIEINPTALVIGAGISGMTAALGLAKHGFLVKLVEREAQLGGLVRRLHRVFPSMEESSTLIDEKVEAIRENPAIQLFTRAEVRQVTGHIGNYAVTITEDGNERKFKVGTIIVATGASVLEPKGLYQYGEQENVLTQLEFESILSGSPSRLAGLNSVVMIQCVGSRSDEFPYCSRICCTTALKNSLTVKRVNPQVEVTIIFRDLQMANLLTEEDLKKARDLGIQFRKYEPSKPPKVKGGKVSLHDTLSGKKLSIPYDLLILSTPLIPRKDASPIAELLKIPADASGFLPDVYTKLKPSQFVDRGIHLCGTAHWPAFVSESVYQAHGAAARGSADLARGTIESESLVAQVNERLCRGCASCLEVCYFQAIEMGKGDVLPNVSKVDPFLCKGCGACAVVCPTSAMTMQPATDRQFFAQIDAALTTAEEPRVLGFCCIWGGYAGADIAGANRLRYPPNLKIIRVDCSARVSPTFILRAFQMGADGVLVAGCPVGECHYQNGNERCEKLVEETMRLLNLLGMEHERLRLEWFSPDEGEQFARSVNEFVGVLRELGPSPLRPSWSGE